MAEPLFDGVRGIIADRDRMFRHTLHSMLRPLGFASLGHTDNLDDIRDAVADGHLDLLVADIGVGEDGLPDLVHRIRHGHLGSNPFLVVVILAADPGPATVRRIIDCGSDVVLLKPMSAGALIERLRNLSANRKSFVVTTDYVGPDRRTSPRPGNQEIPLIEVPNPLSPNERADSPAFQRATEAAIRRINEEKVQRHAFQIGYLINRIAPAYLIGDPVETIRADLDRLLWVVEDLARRLPETRCAHLVQICGSVRQVAERVHARIEKPDEKDVRMMPELASTLRKACEAAGSVPAASAG
ncbi:MAG: response regulator [Magnetospirillum sp. WYHS-4]